MRRVIVGEITGSYGVRGWIKVRSFTQPPGNILQYQPWYLDHSEAATEYCMLAGKPHGSGIVALLRGIDSPEAARTLRGTAILVDRAQFPPADPGEYYWVDLIGLQVRNTAGHALGSVADVMATGANDVLIVRGERERLIPFLKDRTIRSVDLDRGEILVDWDEDF